MMGVTLKAFLALVAVPYLLGILISSKVISSAEEFLRRDIDLPSDNKKIPVRDVMDDDNVEQVSVTNEKCDERLRRILGNDNVFDDLSFVLHRNGEFEPCAQTPHHQVPSLTFQAMRKAVQSFDHCPDKFNKFDVESLLTRLLAHQLLPSTSCASTDKHRRSDPDEGFLGFCDAGPDHTPVLLDHGHLVPVPSANNHSSSLPCRFYTREGVRISSLEQLVQLSRDAKAATASSVCTNQDDDTCSDTQQQKAAELHLYAVPAGRVFMFAPSFVGEIFDLPHVEGSDGLPVYLEVLSISPRIFDVYNFFSKTESADIVERALAETSETHRIKRSSTGASGYNVNSRRTSENGFDTHGKTSMIVKKRCFQVLGFDKYLEGHADGLQVLRYNQTTAYIPHLDWIDDRARRQEHNYDSAGTGGNRFATILLYMSDMREHDGGETVFASAWPVGQSEEERVDTEQAIKELRESGDGDTLAEDSWEEKMVAKCRTRLAIRPNSARAVLFYSQHPNGEPDHASLHGGCPVLGSQPKWAANLWVWNTPREGFAGAPVNEEVVKRNRKANPAPSQNKQLKATFHNTGNDPEFSKADLFYHDGDKYWGPLGHGDPPLNVNTFAGHQWDVKVDGKIVKSWTIEAEVERQRFSI